MALGFGLEYSKGLRLRVGLSSEELEWDSAFELEDSSYTLSHYANDRQ